jgi:hypothetical protein
MGIWKSLFGTEKAYKPDLILFDEKVLVLHSEKPLQIELAPIYGLRIDGTITKERPAMTASGEDCYFVEGIDGIANTPHLRNIRIDAKASRISGNIWHPGTLEAKMVDVTIKRPMTIKTEAEIYAPDFTKAIYYMPTSTLPKKLRAQHDQIELTPEQINGHWEALEETTRNLPQLIIKATSARILYMPQHL